MTPIYLRVDENVLCASARSENKVPVGVRKASAPRRVVMPPATMEESRAMMIKRRARFATADELFAAFKKCNNL